MSEVLVVGGGPAGMFAALFARAAGAEVTLLERGPRLGRKLAITGKGRCNVTNACSVREAQANIPRGARFLTSALYALPPEQVMAFFEERGVPLKVERGARVFPVSDRAADIVGCLKTQLHRAHVRVQTGRATGLLLEEGALRGVTLEQGGALRADAVIVATGGLSYPLTGSTGDGYALARQAGHTIVPPEGSLVPLEEVGDWCRKLQGLSLRNTGVKLLSPEGKCVYEDFGELLFTHFGLSGPTMLSASAHLRAPGRWQVLLDLKPALDAEKLDARVLRDFAAAQNRTLANALGGLYPAAMVPVMLEKCGLDPAMRVNSLPRAGRRALVEQTKRFSIAIRGKRPVEEAIVTTGGVEVRELQSRTMESRLLPGLYFAGEVLDCDAYTGGFNLQIAWATGALAGRSAAERAGI